MIDRLKVKNILLIIETPKIQHNYPSSLPPLGILYLCAVLEKNGFNCDVVDANITPYDIDIIENYDLVGFSLFCSNVESTFDKIKIARNKYPDKLVIMGGPHCEAFIEDYCQNPDLNAIFIGESENTLIQYLTIPISTDLKSVYYRDELSSKFIYNGPSSAFPDLDQLPIPSYNKLPLNKYSFNVSKKSPVVSIITSRGCPFNCSFCYHSHGKKWRPRSPKNIVDEIEFLKNEMNVDEISIHDDNFSIDKLRVIDICNLIVQRNINVYIQITSGIRADMCDEEMLKNLKNAGLWLINVNPESGNEDTLSKIKKGSSLGHVKNLVNLCRKHKIKTFANFIIGFPWEGEKEIRNTHDFALKLNTDFAHFAKLTIFPKTQLYSDFHNLFYMSPFKDIAFFSGETSAPNLHGLTPAKIDNWIKKCVKDFYLRPQTIIYLLQTLSFKKLLRLFLFTLKTKNI
ncbi:MAG: B12-binding domain-containing radical SAM protein [Elusimicrobia bacterium]|nr:B12-binding domain-containing radical SAM protein [Candidatus Liberimonas magnetica]